MKKTLILSIILPELLLFSFAATAQLTLNWSSSFSPAWANGNTSGTASAIGGSTVNCTVNMTKSGGLFTLTGGSSGTQTPTVSASTFTVASSTSNIMVVVDNSTNTDYTDIALSFSGSVTNVVFNIADLDKSTATSTTYYDQVVVTGSNGTTTYNPTITKYDPTTDPNFLIIAGNTANVNTTSSQGGNSASSATDQRGTVIVNFGSNVLTSVRVRYQNATGADANPTAQGIGIGNISFQSSSTLPVTLVSFGAQKKSTDITLQWTTGQELNADKYAIERSTNGVDFTQIGTVAANRINNTTAYTFTDKPLHSSSYYYRLKMVDKDNSYTYSKVVLVNFEISGFTIGKIYPTLFSNTFSVDVFTPNRDKVWLSLTDLTGKRVFIKQYDVEEGANTVKVALSQFIPAGKYMVRVENDHFGKSEMIIKQ